VIPKKSPHIAYIETLKTDINLLIYNCGGVIGLWFGISPITAVDLISKIPGITKILIDECTTILQFLIAFLVRIKQNIISRVIPLVIRFCSLCIAYIETSKTGFIRMIHNCGEILGLWFGILSIKAVNLFGYIALIYWILINECTKIVELLVEFWIRMKPNMTSRVTPIDIRFGNGVQ
jgi:putative component of membrane protein insertase Oxa1/YidC/SpoIIIJ protein YidD